MNIKKEIYTGIDITSWETFFADKEKNILAILNNRFGGKCFAGMFIKSVDEVIECGLCEIDSVPIVGRISVRIGVSALMLDKREVVLAKIINKSPNEIFCKVSDNIFIIVAIKEEQQEFFSSVKNESVVPLILLKVGYKPGQKHISATAEPFLPSFDRFQFRLDASLTGAQLAKIAAIKDKIASLGANAKKFQFFCHVYYPLKNAIAIAANTTLDKMGVGEYTFGPEIQKSTFGVNMLSKSSVVANNSIEVSADEALEIYLSFVRNLIILTEFYTDEIIEQYKFLWKFINEKAKK